MNLKNCISFYFDFLKFSAIFSVAQTFRETNTAEGIPIVICFSSRSPMYGGLFPFRPEICIFCVAGYHCPTKAKMEQMLERERGKKNK